MLFFSKSTKDKKKSSLLIYNQKFCFKTEIFATIIRERILLMVLFILFHLRKNSFFTRESLILWMKSNQRELFDPASQAGVGIKSLA